MREISFEEAALPTRRPSKYDAIIGKIKQMNKNTIIQIDASEYPHPLKNSANFGSGLQSNLRPFDIRVKVRTLADGRGWLVQRLS